MPTQKEIAAALGCSDRYVRTLIDKGMPSDSIAAARAWKHRNILSRETGWNGYGPTAAAVEHWPMTLAMEAAITALPAILKRAGLTAETSSAVMNGIYASLRERLGQHGLIPEAVQFEVDALIDVIEEEQDDDDTDERQQQG